MLHHSTLTQPLLHPVCSHWQVDSILLMLNHALSNQLAWDQLDSMVEEAKALGDPLAVCIARLQLHHNQAVLRLR